MTARYGLEIRRMSGVDAAALSDLLAEADHAVQPRLLEERIARLLASPGAMLVAHEWGPPSGVIVVQWAPDLLDDAPRARLELLLVAVDARRRGVARLLLKAASQAARQAGCVALHAGVSPVGDDLRSFYDASGFEMSAAGRVRPLRRRR